MTEEKKTEIELNPAIQVAVTAEIMRAAVEVYDNKPDRCIVLVEALLHYIASTIVGTSRGSNERIRAALAICHERLDEKVAEGFADACKKMGGPHK